MSCYLQKLTTSKDLAVVIGGSVGGLSAAAVLSRYYAKVVVVERELLSAPSGEVRRSTPQANHVHGLLSSGWRSLEAIFPQIRQRLERAGTRWLHLGKEFRWFHFGKWKASFEERIESPFMSRTCLENAIQDEVRELGNVEIIHARVKSLVGDAQRVSAVVLENGDQLTADLVIDASGRMSQLSEWLAEIGVEPPRKAVISTGIKYCTCRFVYTAEHQAEWGALFVLPKPPLSKAAAIFPLEDGTVMVTLSGRGDDVIPSNEHEFREFTKDLDTDEVYKALEGARAVSDLKHYKVKESRRFFYEERQMPSNLLALGDSVCCFNPIFGQGMTAGLLEACQLERLLAEGKCTSGNYFKAIHPIVKHAWSMITVEDMRYPMFFDQRPLKVKLMQWLTLKVYDKSSEDGELNKMLYEVIHFKRPATDLCKPWAISRLLR